MDAETRAAIDWLNSFEGRRWSRDHHFQSPYALRMFMIKEEDARGEVWSEQWQSWGRVDTLGRYRKPTKRKSLRKPYFNSYTETLAEALEDSLWYADLEGSQ